MDNKTNNKMKKMKQHNYKNLAKTNMEHKTNNKIKKLKKWKKQNYQNFNEN